MKRLRINDGKGIKGFYESKGNKYARSINNCCGK